MIGLLVGGVGAVTYGLFFMSSDEEEIRELCARLEAALTFSDGANPAFLAIEIKDRLKDVFGPGATIVVPEAGAGPLQVPELVAGAVQFAGRYKSAVVDLDDVRISGLTDSAATVDCRAVATGFDFAGAPRRHERQVRMDVAKVDGDWRIMRVVAAPSPEPAPAP